MKILITGATGLIGSALIKFWQEQHQLIALTRSAVNAEQLVSQGIAAVTELSQVDFNQLDAVINLAGEPILGKRWSAKHKQLLCQSRWQLTEQLYQAISTANTPPGIFISGSAIGYYGAQNQQIITEDYSHPFADFSHTLCQRWEEIALQASSATTRVCLLRTGIVLAKQGGALKRMLLPFKLGLGGKIGSGQQYMSWIHIEDMVGLIDFLLLHPTLQGAFNATAPYPVTNSEFTQQLATTLRRPAILPLPSPVLRLIMGEMADLVLNSQRVVPARLTAASFQFAYPQLDDALTAILAR
ncbi:TIGR01777 family oxidoreductase [Rheinheimera sp. MMS21-TC3]|uniref:TIGR01777 family oxidoreductase n=1 Tax=Rheinheimera sp. MMS21-TC3 TaxID=3072790 RepID=UPI0028C45688|nr:TIGR01777 family oxidoreductase [Rheinheimera sp. MMS21-TC3]WNO60706.1 TIGR01777 family oxidoreductase [Rheinheimera sp. MMS21-TC3]